MMNEKISDQRELVLKDNRELPNFVVHFYNKYLADPSRYKETTFPKMQQYLNRLMAILSLTVT